MSAEGPPPRSPAGAAAAIGGLLAGVTAALAVLDPSPASPWRHAYFLPVAAAAWRFGAGGGLVAATAAALLDAPFLLPALERGGPSAQAAEGLVTLGLLLVVGALGGRLAAQAGRQRERFETAVALQRVVADASPLEVVLDRLRVYLTARLGAEIGLVVREGQRLVVAGGQTVAPGSPAATVLGTGEPLFVPDAAPGPRPQRILVVPLLASGRPVGALAVERRADIGAEERGALAALGAHLGLALDNARLAAAQRRFAEELAHKVAAATARLAEMDRLKSEFVAIASHELRTPLTALKGFSELLETRRFSPEDVRRLAGIVRGETDRLGRIVADLLDLSRLERGLRPALRRARVDVGAAITTVVELATRASPSRGIEVGCDAALPPVDADPDALDRVLTNLVSNALKYSPPSSTVRVRARAAAGGVEIAVEDEGPGVAAEDRELIFEPYYRAPGMAGAAPGAGLGLAVVKALLDAHGGSIRCEPAPGGRGTRMTVVLPAAA